MALSILKPLMFFFNSTLSSPKKVWFHLAQWFHRGLIVKVYRGQQMPSCSNTSHDRYNLHQSCVPDLYHTTEWLFSGGGGTPPKKRGTSRCMTTLNEEYKGRVTFCSHLASVVSELLDLIFSSESTWQIETKRDMIWMFIEWFPTKTCVVVSKEGVSILYMDFNYISPSNEGRHIVLVWFFSSASASSQRSLSGP